MDFSVTSDMTSTDDHETTRADGAKKRVVVHY